ncbi:MAG: PilW family protein [Gammaproteobacteria bacterium]|nr:PilW family protein [Gammaproteobacteria bacterium]
MSNFINIKSRYSQQGLSLVELMIATTVSLLLMAGVGQIFLSTKASNSLQNGAGRLQENARLAFEILSQNIGQAGFTTDLSGISAFNSANTLENGSENAGLGFTTANGTASDVIEINYVSATDCLGNGTGASGTATDRYFIAGNQLMCLGNGNAAAGILGIGIENMQLLYGEDTDDDNIANLFVNKDNVTTWEDIKSVRISLLVTTTQAMTITDSLTHVLLNTPPILPINDNALRRVFTRTILIRNN